MASDVQSKFDDSKTADCAHCRVPDGQDHWLVCPRYEHFRCDADLPVGRPQPGTAWSTHLLPERNPYAAALKLEFHSVRLCFDFVSSPSVGCQHLFTDGSFIDYGGMYHGLAAWSIYNQTTGLPVLAQHLTGIVQSIDRAELMALVGALQWSHEHLCQVHVWADSQYVVNGFHHLKAVGVVPFHWANRGLWEQVLAFQQSLRYAPGCTWISSHLDPLLCADSFEDWVRVGNDVADKLAVDFNLQRFLGFWALLRSSMGWCETGRQQLQWLQKFYFQIAASEPSMDPPAPSALTPEPSSEWLERLPSVVPLDWPHFVHSFDFGPRALPTQFYVLVMTFLLDVDSQSVGAGAQIVSFLELTLAMAVVQPIDFPHWNAQAGGWSVQPLTNLFTRPTVSVLLACVRQAVHDLADRFDFRDRCVERCCKPHLGLHKQMGGIKLFVGSLWPVIQSATAAFCQVRPVRRACDLARPLPAVT